MARGGVKALYVLAALASGVSPLAAQAVSEPVTGFAGSGTADKVPVRAGDAAPPHLTGEAPRPGDAAGAPRAGTAAETAATQAEKARSEAAAEERQHVGRVAHVTVEAQPGAPTPVVVELPPAPAAPTGLDATPAPVVPPKRTIVQQPAPATTAQQPAPATAPAVTTAAPTTPVPTTPVPTSPAPTLAQQPADPLAPIAAAIAKQLATPATGKDQEAIAAFYGARSDAPAFVDQKGYTARGKAVIARFEAAGEDGLDPAAYKVAPLPPKADADALAQAELRLAASILTYARHAQAGRFDPTRISPSLTPTRTFPDQLSVLHAVSGASNAGAALAAYNPPHKGYAELKAKLAEAQSKAPAATKSVPRIPDGMRIRPGEVDVRVPLLRERLGLPASTAANDRIYDPQTVQAVRTFQSGAGLEADGVVGAGTLAALNEIGAPRDRVAEIIVNMERWRWLPRDLGSAYVMVNIPEYMVRIVDDGRVIHETRVVVGKPDTPTPLLTHDMEYVVVNPSWNVPVSIARKEMLPNLQRDPYYLQRQGITIERNGRAVDPGSVNWQAGLGGYSFRQPPGERNALGRIKFMFPNQHSVYLHDTPSRTLFANDRRAYSHGCVRVQDPLSFGEVIFSLGMPNDGWTEEKIGKMFGGQERYINLKRRIPVHIAYFTAYVDGAGRLVTRPDIYGIDEKMEEILGLGGAQQMAAGKAKTATR